MLLPAHYYCPSIAGLDRVWATSAHQTLSPIGRSHLERDPWMDRTQ
jgi:hypothetical protein